MTPDLGRGAKSKDIVAKLSEGWDALLPEGKEPYRTQAEVAKKSARGAAGQDSNSVGVGADVMKVEGMCSADAAVMSPRSGLLSRRRSMPESGAEPH